MATTTKAIGRTLRQAVPAWRSRSYIAASQVSHLCQSRRGATTSAENGTREDRPLVQRYLLNPRHDSPRGPDVPPVQFEYKGETINISPAWLRDSCTCSLCVDQSSKQKRFATTDIPADISAVVESLDSNGMTLRWSHDIPGTPPDHRTTLSSQQLDEILVGVRSPILAARFSRVRWNSSGLVADSKLDFTYQEYMQDDSVVLRALAQLDSFGLMFINDVPEDEHAINGLVERIGPLKNTFYGLTWDVRSVPEAKNVAYTSGDLDFHMDLMYVQDPPALQFLHCIRTSAKGGASRFTDILTSISNLVGRDSTMLDVLVSMDVPYEYRNDSQHYKQARPIVSLPPAYRRAYNLGNMDRLDKLTAVNYEATFAWSPQFQGRFVAKHGITTGKRGRAIERWLDVAKKVRRGFEGEDCIYERMLKPGQCVIFDNRRILHARTAFEVSDAGKERFLKGAYLDKDVWASRRAVLTEKYPELASELRLKAWQLSRWTREGQQAHDKRE